MSVLDTEGIDWDGLRRLRRGFLEASSGHGSYWDSTAALHDYDRTFGERIGWKWDHVLDELEVRGWRPPSGLVLDWGCGSGVAGRRVMDRFPGSGPLSCVDRSPRAEEYARRRAVDEGFEVVDGGPPTTLVLSHVIGEIDETGRERLIEMARAATAVVWVEPGDHRSSRSLVEVRERLVGAMTVVAPCTHQEVCGLLAEGNERHWCHHFAAPPPEVFTDPGWGRFTSETGIDLRSVPLSFLVLDSRPTPVLGADAVHTIGRPRIYKPEARVFGCDASGVADVRITKRRLPDVYRQAKKGSLPTLARWRCEGDEVVDWTSS